MKKTSNQTGGSKDLDLDYTSDWLVDCGYFPPPPQSICQSSSLQGWDYFFHYLGLEWISGIARPDSAANQARTILDERVFSR